MNIQIMLIIIIIIIVIIVIIVIISIIIIIIIIIRPDSRLDFPESQVGKRPKCQRLDSGSSCCCMVIANNLGT